MEAMFRTLVEHAQVLLAVIPVGLVAFFFFDLVQYCTKRDFEHVNVYEILFTRHDHESSSDQVQLRLLSYRMPLQDVVRSSYVLFAKVLLASLKVTSERPVLDLGTDARGVLASIRGEILEGNAEAEFARAAGNPFIETTYQMTLLNDLSDVDRRVKILRAVLIQERDLQEFEQYLRKPPMNSRNLDLVKKVKEAFDQKPLNFLDIAITTTR